MMVEDDEEPELSREAVDPEIADLMPRFMLFLSRDVDALDEALKSWDLDELCRVSHGMKGYGSSFGFRELTRLGGRLEAAGASRAEAAIRGAAAVLIRYARRVLEQANEPPRELPPAGDPSSER